jgi:hypothetical protein
MAGLFLGAVVLLYVLSPLLHGRFAGLLWLVAALLPLPVWLAPDRPVDFALFLVAGPALAALVSLFMLARKPALIALWTVPVWLMLLLILTETREYVIGPAVCVLGLFWLVLWRKQLIRKA